MNRLRSAAAVLCGILLVAGILAGVIATYATRTLFDAAMFSNRVAESLGEPRVARVVANQLTDQVIALRRDLTPYRPIVLGVVEHVVSSAPFRALAKLAAKKVHPRLIAGGESLSLSLADLGLILRDALSMYPQLAEKVPARAQFMLGSTEGWPAGQNLLRVLQLGHRMQKRSVVWLTLGLLAGTLGLFLARLKDRYLLRVGLGLTIASLLLAGVARFGGALLAGLAPSPVASDLIGGLWSVFLAPLATHMLVLAGLGIVLVAGVTTFLEKLNVSTIARVLWQRAGRRPAWAGWVIVRGLVLAALGILGIFHPSEAIEVVVVVGAGLVFFVGIQDVFATATRFARRVESTVAAQGKKKKARSYVPAVVAAAILVPIVVAAALWIARGPEPAAIGPVEITECNGYAELCDQRLNEVVFPTTHNSMSAASIASWMFPNQERGIEDQLEDGVRGFLLDIHYGIPVKGRIKTLLEFEVNSRAKYEASLGKAGIEAAMRIRDRLVGEASGEQGVYMGHGFCEIGATPFVEALESMKDFLVRNPNEVLIMVIQDEGVTPSDVAVCFEKSGLVDFVYRGAVAPPWPTLAEMVARNERVVVLAENHAEGVPWYHLMSGVLQETPYRFKTPEQFSNAPNRGGKEGSLLLMNHWIESAPASLPSNAEIVNSYEFLLQRARACRRERGMLPNLVAVDFYQTGDLFTVCRSLNGISEPAGPMIQ